MENGKLARGPMIAITVLRVLVGWHFLYEGIAKLTSATWSAAGYLRQARGPASGVFKWLASQPNLLGYADQITMWGLTAVGLLLVLGLFTRLSSLGAIGFLVCLELPMMTAGIRRGYHMEAIVSPSARPPYSRRARQRPT